jgi:hypothetical protein
MHTGAMLMILPDPKPLMTLHSICALENEFLGDLQQRCEDVQENNVISNR